MITQLAVLETEYQTATNSAQRMAALNKLIWALCPLDLTRAAALLDEATQMLTDLQPVLTQAALADHQVNQALYSYYQDRYEQALQCAETVLALAGVEPESLTRCKALEVAAICHIRLGKPADALAQLMAALDIATHPTDQGADQGTDQGRMTTIYNLLAILYVNLGDHAKGVTYFEQSLAFARQVGDLYAEARALSNLCMGYKDLGRYADSLTTGLAGLALAHRHQIHGIEMWVLTNLANTHIALGEAETAFDYFKQAAQLTNAIGSHFDQASTLLSMARAFYKEQKFALAQSYARLVLEIAETSKQQGFQFEAHELLSAIYKIEGNYCQALTHYEAFHRIKEAIFNTEADDKRKQLEVAYRTEAAQREAEIYRLRYVELQHEIAERERTQKAMLQTQKLESLGILAGGVAHDFNNLLVAILGQTELALRKLSLDHAARKNLVKVNEAAERAANLSLKMLAYSGQGRFEVVRCTLRDLLTGNEQLWFSAIGSHCQLHFDTAACDPLLEIDKGQIEQLLTNLLMNAAEAEAESITIRTACHTVCPHTIAEDAHFWQYTAQPLAPGPYLLIIVADDGIGMMPEMLERIFDPFFTTKFTGRGLGLAASLGIVRGHSGGISVQSHPGAGTTFYILLPCLQEQAQALPPAQPEDAFVPAHPFNKPRTVLVIDDQPEIRETVAETLAHYEINVVTFGDGLAGVNYYAAHAKEVDLVLLDLTMLGMNGIQTWQQLRTINPAVKVILSSGFNTADVIDRIAEPILILQKPYHPETLINTLRQQLN